ncbi:hypothetical protein SLS62_000820 [Diatrype stigma]|uniref:Uncharacterized protein n=1 Tax=Diatrype stigma TaxID=117547 RepID=A0AAN9V0I6_9PEZI
MAATLSPDSHHRHHHHHHHHQYAPSRRDASPSCGSVSARPTRPSPSRDSSSSRRQPSRPRLLRACATEPSITTSNSCSGVLTAPNTSRRATELLSRVAVSNSAATEGLLRLSPTVSPTSSTQSFGGSGEADRGRMGDGARRQQQQLSEDAAAAATAQRMMLHRSCTGQQQHSANYFSFPSFDEWEQPAQQNQEKAY